MDALRAAAIGVDHPDAGGLVTALASSTVAISTATSLLFVTAASPTATPSPPPPSSPHDSEGECQLLGSFALLVQAALGGLALLALVYKRWRERPQRPVKIWAFDASKQVFGSVLVHIANIFMSMLTSGRFSITAANVVSRGTTASAAAAPYMPNPCSFYLLNLGIDTTLGIPILIGLLHLLTAVVALTPVGKPRESIQSGHYGNPPNAWWWLKQSVIYFCGLFLMKICVLIIFITMPWISKVGDWALSWTEGNEKLQIAFVMMIFPLIMNALQYYIIDSFIKKPISETDPLDDDEHRQFRPLRPDDDSLQDLDSDGDADDEAPLVDKASTRTRTTKAGNAGRRGAGSEEYDPDLDGDANTIIGSSSSSTGAKPSTPVTMNLLPKE
ncbi:vacuolar membrane protein [Cordyceps fumosorosea ARSEF 2679]|uniref:Vacuolar membrane protein n=1 Tax=Cordyceps fumosorosea (strain ARSEF 2679) TaxID=1081104 RepID=A0A162LQ57_CORFA|nr:vacuolar membrane protein [Cordyceps fumosorosea ARSEF 2679]OAA74014.1 vacuolar membrane protein [Cordyceps fumosorosea ARSEF 2679]